MFTRLKPTLKNEKGQAAMELAIILPVILLIVMFIVYAGILTFAKSTVLIATHQGGREGLQHWNVGSLSQQEKEQKMHDATMRILSALPRGSDSDITVYDDRLGKITINVTYYFKLNLPFLKSITGYEAIPISSELSYRYTREAEGW